jgi:hypothetical protein
MEDALWTPGKYDLCQDKGGHKGYTHTKTALKDVECYRCRKKGHYVPDCNKPTLQKFTAQVINEDAENLPPPQSPQSKEMEAEESAPGEEKHTEALQGAQYKLEQEEKPLDQ